MGAKLSQGWSADVVCKKCHELESECICHMSHEIKTPHEHRLTLAMEKRHGKVVTLVKPFFLESKTQEQLLKKLKASLATGGSCKNDVLEFQGECRTKVKELLQKEGYRFK